MQPSINTPQPSKSNWVYATLTVVDGSRQLKPTHLSFDRLRFTEPPRLTSSQVEIILTNGDDQHHYTAAVLSHEADATLIPIRMVVA
jgi:hypothetical protein